VILFFGERKYGPAQFWLDRQKLKLKNLAQRGLTVRPSWSALGQEQNVQVPRGSIGATTGSYRTRPYQVSVRAIGRVSEARAILTTLVFEDGSGGTLGCR